VSHSLARIMENVLKKKTRFRASVLEITKAILVKVGSV
jgi:hypothetical protein